MIDLIYIVVTVLFFGLTLLYVAGCARLGRAADVERASEEAQ